MASTDDAKSTRTRSVRLTAGIILGVAIALGTFTGSANADEHRGRGEHWDRGRHEGWRGGYYRAPPVVYGSPYYAPPVVYGPGFGLNLNIR